MKRSVLFFAAVLLSVTLLAGCGAILTHAKATKAMHDGRYEESVALFKEVLQKDGNNVEALKGLGETYLRMKKPAEAVPVLEKARVLSQGDKVACINLGLAFNLLGEYDKAIAAWRIVVDKNPDSNVSAMLRRQITLALYRDAVKQAKEAVKQEAALKAVAGKPNVLAVTNFGDKGLSEQARPLRKALAAMLITDLSKVKSLQVVERVRLQKLAEELNLGTSGVVDAGTAPRVGRLLGAGRVVTGSMVAAGGEKLDIGGLLTDVATGGEAGKQEAGGALQEFFKIEKALAFGIIRDAGIRLSPQEEETIGRYATKSYPGLLYYGQGLDAQDRGEWDKAVDIFQRCVKEDQGGPCSAALKEAPSGADVAASGDAAAMSAAMGEGDAADAAAAAESGASGGGDGGC